MAAPLSASETASRASLTLGPAPTAADVSIGWPTEGVGVTTPLADGGFGGNIVSFVGRSLLEMCGLFTSCSIWLKVRLGVGGIKPDGAGGMFIGFAIGAGEAVGAGVFHAGIG